MKTPRPLGLSTAEAKELSEYMANQYLDKTRWPALARLLGRLTQEQRIDNDKLNVAFHSEPGGC